MITDNAKSVAYIIMQIVMASLRMAARPFLERRIIVRHAGTNVRMNKLVYMMNRTGMIYRRSVATTGQIDLNYQDLAGGQSGNWRYGERYKKTIFFIWAKVTDVGSRASDSSEDPLP